MSTASLRSEVRRLRERRSSAHFDIPGDRLEFASSVGLAELDSRMCDPATVETNMVYADFSVFGRSAMEIADRVLADGIITLGLPGGVMRLVTHRDVPPDGVDRAVAAFGRAVRA